MQKVKIFLGSSDKVNTERERFIVLLNEVRKSHKHLDLEAIEFLSHR
jgi:hypothetical protein